MNVMQSKQVEDIAFSHNFVFNYLSHVTPNPYDWLSSMKHERGYLKNISVCCFLHTVKSGNLQLFHNLL